MFIKKKVQSTKKKTSTARKVKLKKNNELEDSTTSPIKEIKNKK